MNYRIGRLSFKVRAVDHLITLGETCDLYVLMRRRDKAKSLPNWEMWIQTIHVMLFLVYLFLYFMMCSPDDRNSDITIKRFTKPLIYKDLLLSAVFRDVLSTDEGKSIPPPPLLA